MKKDKRLHMIGNAHIDPVWLWRWQEGFQEIKSTFRSVLDRMDEFEDFVFTSSSALFYEWVEENNPEMFAEIQKRVAEGRWELAGGWWIQSDCNIPNGESFVRQALLGQRYFLSKFNAIATYGYNVDSFGHNGMIPQILAKSGCDAYVFMRPMPNEKSLPARLFLWESDDGSKVKAFRLPYEYCTWVDDLRNHVIRCADEITSPLNSSMCFYGVGNHGGGPTKENIHSIHALNKEADMPELVMSTPRRFFDEVDAKQTRMPIYHGDLHHHASGCYSAHSEVKMLNRIAENRLLTAEKYAVAAALMDKAVATDALNLGWKQVLFNQFHDTVSGTSLPEAYQDAAYQYGEAISIADRVANHAIQRLSWAIDIPFEEGCRPLVVFNPHGFTKAMVVAAEVGRLKDTEILVDEDGGEVVFQVVQSEVLANGRVRIAFVTELPSMGWRTFRLLEQEKERAPLSETMIATDTSMENEWLRVEFDPESGAITSLVDKAIGASVINGGGALPIILDDDSDTWSHGVYSFWGRGAQHTGSCTSVRLVEHGPVVSTIEVEHAHGNSSIIQQFSLWAALKRIDVKVLVSWQEKQQMLKLQFPLNLDFRKAVSETPFGIIERAFNGEEESGQTWMDGCGQLRGTKQLYGLALANDGKYSLDFNDDTMHLTVLRSPIYAHHDPAVPEEGVTYHYQDQGPQTFNYSLVPHTGNWHASSIIEVAAELNQRPTWILESFHDGPLAQQDSLLQIDQQNIVLSALKPAYDTEGFVLRCYEAHGNETQATMRISAVDCTIEARFGPFEIKTFKVEKQSDGGWKAVETNLLELTEKEMQQIQSGKYIQPKGRR
ncbi:MAG TPA: glycoside hydrolase family 38 C-terminal domain-containing protein [Sphaerochaeta sp.]|nr:glycoside hydrolase family 38 C-terminal domain-containing protein [Sphaerochaeta sp.]